MEKKGEQKEIGKNKEKHDHIISRKFIQLSFAIPIILALTGMGIGYLFALNKSKTIQKIALIAGTLTGLLLSIGYGFFVGYIMKRKIANLKKESNQNERKENNKNLIKKQD